MAQVKRKYKRGIIKFLLATVYLFFFAAQINGRFYSIANFYVYGDNQAGRATASIVTDATASAGAVAAAAIKSSPEFKANHTPAEIEASPLSSKVKGEKSRYPTTRPANLHLSLDKRFQCRYPVQATLSDSLLILFAYAEFKRKYTVCNQAVKSFDRSTNCLRGPPAA